MHDGPRIAAAMLDAACLSTLMWLAIAFVLP
jgi:hypothetical protein